MNTLQHSGFLRRVTLKSGCNPRHAHFSFLHPQKICVGIFINSVTTNNKVQILCYFWVLRLRFSLLLLTLSKQACYFFVTFICIWGELSDQTFVCISASTDIVKTKLNVATHHSTWKGYPIGLSRKWGTLSQMQSTVWPRCPGTQIRS